MNRAKKIVHYHRNWLGKNCVVVVVDTGVSAHPDLDGQIWQFRDFSKTQTVLYDNKMRNALECDRCGSASCGENQIQMYDDNGHGTHVCGIIAGKRMGMAPECRLIVLKVLDHTGNGNVKHSMAAFRWILENQEKYNIRVVNISMGMEPRQNPEGERYILKAVELLWDMGIVVVAAAGNLGPDAGSVTIPGLHKKIITVGAYDNLRSGQGSVSENIMKPDLVAPGSNILSCNAQWEKAYPERKGQIMRKQNLYIKKSGTSMATPIVTGAIAQLLSKNPNLPNTEVKRMLMNSCDDLRLPKTRQGSGLLNVGKLLK